MIDINILLLIGYCIVVLLIGYFSSKDESTEDFLISNRNLGPWALAFTIAATLIGGNAVVTYGSFFYKYGLPMFAGFIGVGIGLVLIIMIAKKVKKESDKKKYHTLSDIYYENYDKKTGLYATIIIILWFLMVLMVQFIAGGKLIAAVTNMNYITAVLIMGLIVFAYLTLGGFRAVVKTDIFQFLLLILLAIIIAAHIIGSGIITKEIVFGDGLDITTAIAFMIMGASIITVGADMWPRIYAAKDIKTIKLGFIIAGIVTIIALLGIGMIALATKAAFPETLAEDAIIVGFTELLPPWLESAGFILLFAVIMSTVDTTLFVLATIFSKDIFQRFVNKKINMVLYTRIGGLIFGFLAMIIALFFQDIVRIGLAFASIGLVFAPSIIGAHFWKLKNKAVRLSLLVGGLAVLIVFSLGFQEPETSIISLPVSILCLIIGQWFYRK